MIAIDTQLAAMASMDEVRAYVDEAIGKNNDTIGTILQQAQTTLDEMKVQRDNIVAEVFTQKGRIDTQIMEVNAAKDLIFAQTTNLDQRSTAAAAQFSDLVEKLEAFGVTQTEGLARTQASAAEAIGQLRSNIEIWANGFRAECAEKLSAGGGKNHGQAHGPRVDKKEIQVWKLQDDVGKESFRHWLGAIDVQLEAVHGLAFPKVVLDKVRRQGTPITKESFHVVLQKASEEIHAKDPERLADEVDHTNWAFDEKGRFLYSYLIGKFNTELHSKTVGIADKKWI